MNSHATAYGLIVSALVACGGASAAPAPGANTSGLTVAISKIAVNQREMTLQFTMKNNSKGRAHVLIAVADRKLYGFLGSGEQLGSFPRVSGINACSSPLQNCSSMPYVRDLSHFGSIEPSDLTAFSLTWTAQSPVSDKDTLLIYCADRRAVFIGKRRSGAGRGGEGAFVQLFLGAFGPRQLTAKAEAAG